MYDKISRLPLRVMKCRHKTSKMCRLYTNSGPEVGIREKLQSNSGPTFGPEFGCTF